MDDCKHVFVHARGDVVPCELVARHRGPHIGWFDSKVRRGMAQDIRWVNKENTARGRDVIPK